VWLPAWLPRGCYTEAAMTMPTGPVNPQHEGAESTFVWCPARGRTGPRAQRSRTLAVHTLRSQRPFAPGLQFLLASRSLVAALPVQ